MSASDPAYPPVTDDRSPVIVVGGGIAGLACAGRVRRAGLPVTVLDRGRRLGGRMAVRTVENRAVDTGASYFTVDDPAFEAVVTDWQRRGLARPWTDTFATTEHGALAGDKSGPIRWAAPHGLRSLVEDLARGLDVVHDEVQEVGPGHYVDGHAARAVVLAMPDPQARRLLHHDHADLAARLDRSWDPSIALYAGWESRSWPDLDGAFVDAGPIRWVADDGRRRADDAPVLVAHASVEHARAHLDDPEAAAPAMLAALDSLLGTGRPRWHRVQRWTYANPAGERAEPFLLGEEGIGVCGDGWGPRSRVELAFGSGLALGEELVRRLT